MEWTASDPIRHSFMSFKSLIGCKIVCSSINTRIYTYTIYMHLKIYTYIQTDRQTDRQTFLVSFWWKECDNNETGFYRRYLFTFQLFGIHVTSGSPRKTSAEAARNIHNSIQWWGNRSCNHCMVLSNFARYVFMLQ